MRSGALLSLAVLVATLTACGRSDADDRSSAAREAGRAAYRLSEDSKRAARELGRDLKQAGSEARKGWSEARSERKSRPRK